MKILDCTLRDGGYYTEWDFNKSQVNQYILALNNLPIDYIEVGYRSPLQNEYHGKYFYLPLYELKDLKSKTNKKLVIILNEKDVRVEHLEELLSPLVGLVDMVRMAIDPANLGRAVDLAKAVKQYGFEVGFNVMYMSKWKQNPQFLEELNQVNGFVDCFYMVDSYGGVYPNDVKEIIDLLKERISCPLGFHGHNNLELALMNTLTALDCGVEYVDATILGMGRGAGNLKTELLLTVLNKKYNIEVDFNALERAVSAIEPLLKQYEWGTNLPYMISGANSLAQKNVMDWVTTRFYSLNSIVRALDNQKNSIVDNKQFPIAILPKVERVLIVGGGPSVKLQVDGLITFLNSNPDITIIHASSKNAAFFKELPNKQYFCLVGNEGVRLESTLNDLFHFNGVCVLPPYPRKMGTYVPDSVVNKTYELKDLNFTDKFKDAQTAIALQVALDSEPNEIFVVGYDGYKGMTVSDKEIQLVKENEYLFEKISSLSLKISSLTYTNYNLNCSDNLFFKLLR